MRLKWLLFLNFLFKTKDRAIGNFLFLRFSIFGVLFYGTFFINGWVSIPLICYALYAFVAVSIAEDTNEHILWGSTLYHKYGKNNNKLIKSEKNRLEKKSHLEGLYTFFKATPNILVFIETYEHLYDKDGLFIDSSVYNEFIRVYKMNEPLPLFMEKLLSEKAFLFAEMDKLLRANISEEKPNNNLLLKTFMKTNSLIQELYSINLGSIHYEDRLDEMLNSVSQDIQTSNSLKLDKEQ